MAIRIYMGKDLEMNERMTGENLSFLYDNKDVIVESELKPEEILEELSEILESDIKMDAEGYLTQNGTPTTAHIL